jgi:hypothetical protein
MNRQIIDTYIPEDRSPGAAIAERREIIANLEAAASLLLQVRHYVTSNEASALCSHISAVFHDHEEIISAMEQRQAAAFRDRWAREARNAGG